MVSKKYLKKIFHQKYKFFNSFSYVCVMIIKQNPYTMKNIIYFSLTALAIVFSACSKDLTQQAEEESDVYAIRQKNVDGEYTVTSDGLDIVVIDGKPEYVTRFKLIDDDGNTEFAYCADMNTPCYEGSRYKSVSADGYFQNGEDVKIKAALTYMMNEYGSMENTNPRGYRQMTQCILWRIIHGYEVTSVNNKEGAIIKDVIDHIYNNIDDLTEGYSTSLSMEGEGYGPYRVAENALLKDVVFDLTFDQGGDFAKFIDENGAEITQVKIGEPFFVKITDGASGDFRFTATASTTKELWYVNDFQFFIDVRDVNFPTKHEYQPLFQPLTTQDARTYFYSCSANLTITPTEPETEKITLTGLSWNNGVGNGNGAGINQFTVNGIVLKNNKNFVTPVTFDVLVSKTPGKNEETAIYAVTERTVENNGKYVKIYDVKVALYTENLWKGYGGSITVDNPGGNNANQKVDLERIF